MRKSRAGRDTIESREIYASNDSSVAWDIAWESFSSEGSEVLAIVPGTHSSETITESKFMTGDK